MKTKITSALLILAILFSFAACAKPAADTTTLAATAVQTTVRETETTAPETITEPVTENNTDSRTGAPTTAATAKTTTQAATTSNVKTFTAAQLAEFNGKNGKNAYIAYDGVVYDVTSKLDRTWKNGVHHGLLVGTDLTLQVNNCKEHAKNFITAQFSTYPKVGNYIG